MQPKAEYALLPNIEDFVSQKEPVDEPYTQAEGSHLAMSSQEGILGAGTPANLPHHGKCLVSLCSSALASAG